MNKLKSSRIDWLVTLAPFIIIMALAGVLFTFPDASNDMILSAKSDISLGTQWESII